MPSKRGRLVVLHRVKAVHPRHQVSATRHDPRAVRCPVNAGDRVVGMAVGSQEVHGGHAAGKAGRMPHLDAVNGQQIGGQR